MNAAERAFKRVTGADFRGASGTAWMTVAFFGGYALQGAYFVILARTLGPVGLGTFAGALALISAVAPFSGAGGGNLLVMRVSRDSGTINEEIGRAAILLLISAGFFTVVVAALRFTVFDHLKLAPLLLPFCVSELWAGRLVDLAGQCFQSFEELRTTARVTVNLSLFRLVVIAAFVVFGSHRSPSSFAWWYVGASIAAALLATLAVLRRFGLPCITPPVNWGVGTGIAFSLGTASKSVYGDIDKFMLSGIGTASSTGIYTAAYRIVSMSFAPVFAYCYAANTRFFKAGAESGAELWLIVRAAYPRILGYTLVVSVGLVVLAPVMPLVLGGGYRESVAALRWLAVMPIVQGAHSLFGDALMGRGKQRSRASAQLAAAILNIALNLWLIPAYSWRGAAVASILSEGVLAGVLLLMLRRATQDAQPQRVSTANLMSSEEPPL